LASLPGLGRKRFQVFLDEANKHISFSESETRLHSFPQVALLVAKYDVLAENMDVPWNVFERE
jgi:hypothetical protein